MKKPRCIRNHPDFILTLHGDKNPRYEKLLDVLSDGNIDPLKVESFAKESNKKLSKYKDLDIEIIVCVHNAPKETLNCLNSISKNRTKKTKLIVVDDGSGEETKKILQEFVHGKDWVGLLRNETANGYTKAANKGLRASTAPLVILQNSDTVVTKDWATKMAYVLDVSPGTGIVGTLSSAAGHQSIPRHKSTKTQTAINRLPKSITPEHINSLCEKWALDVYPRVPLVHGFCFGIKREVIEKIGYFDEQKFPRGYGEENDYCFRATNAGISSVIATNTYVYHEKSKSYVDEVRIGLMKSGSQQLTKTHGANRIKNSVLAVDFNPLIENVRQKYITHFKV